jgi:hypothetical protein
VLRYPGNVAIQQRASARVLRQHRQHVSHQVVVTATRSLEKIVLTCLRQVRGLVKESLDLL